MFIRAWVLGRAICMCMISVSECSRVIVLLATCVSLPTCGREPRTMLSSPPLQHHPLCSAISPRRTPWRLTALSYRLVVADTSTRSRHSTRLSVLLCQRIPPMPPPPGPPSRLPVPPWRFFDTPAEAQVLFSIWHSNTGVASLCLMSLWPHLQPPLSILYRSDLTDAYPRLLLAGLYAHTRISTAK